MLVLAATWVAGRLLLPETRWEQLGRELLASLTYRENWELIDSQLGYGAAGALTSPVQHFWSMSVQGQFYIAFLALILVFAFAFRRLFGSHMRAAFVVLLAGLYLGTLPLRAEMQAQQARQCVPAVALDQYRTHRAAEVDRVVLLGVPTAGRRRGGGGYDTSQFP